MPKFDIAKLRIDLSKVDVPKPVYVGAGVAVLTVETVKVYVDTVSKLVTGYRSDVTARVNDYQKQVAGFEPKSFADSIQTRANAGVASLAAEAKARRAAIESRVSDLQSEAKALPGLATSFYKGTSSEAAGAYDDLAKRGEELLARLRGEVPAEVAVTVEGETVPPSNTVADAVSDTAESAGETPTDAPAKRTPAAKKAPAKKAPAKKAPPKKA